MHSSLPRRPGGMEHVPASHAWMHAAGCRADRRRACSPRGCSLMLMVTNVYALLDQLSAMLGTTGSPPLLAVIVVLCSLLFVNGLMYVMLMVRAEKRGCMILSEGMQRAPHALLPPRPPSKHLTYLPPPAHRVQHVLYAIMLKGMGLRLHRLPRFAERLVGQIAEA